MLMSLTWICKTVSPDSTQKIKQFLLPGGFCSISADLQQQVPSERSKTPAFESLLDLKTSQDLLLPRQLNQACGYLVRTAVNMISSQLINKGNPWIQGHGTSVIDRSIVDQFYLLLIYLCKTRICPIFQVDHLRLYQLINLVLSTVNH